MKQAMQVKVKKWFVLLLVASIPMLGVSFLPRLAQAVPISLSNSDITSGAFSSLIGSSVASAFSSGFDYLRISLIVNT